MRELPVASYYCVQGLLPAYIELLMGNWCVEEYRGNPRGSDCSSSCGWGLGVLEVVFRPPFILDEPQAEPSIVYLTSKSSFIIAEWEFLFEAMFISRMLSF